MSIQQYKAERGWYNLKISRQTLTDAMYDAAERGEKGIETWYRLLIPELELERERHLAELRMKNDKQE